MPSLKLQEALSPAARYYFVTGIFPHTHVCGARNHATWNCEVDPSLPRCAGPMPVPGAMALLMMREDEREALWLQHRSALIAEARAFGFTPAAEQWSVGTLASDTPVAAEASAAWRRAFMNRSNR